MTLSLSLSLSLGANSRVITAEQLRLQASLEASGGQLRQVMESDPLTYAGSTTTSASLPVAIAKDDSRIRFLGGNWYNGTGSFPNTSFRYCMPRSSGELTTIQGSTGLPINRGCGVQAFEFTLPAGQTEFEVLFRSQVVGGQVYVDVDGVGTNAGGYSWTIGVNGFQWRKFTLPSSASAQVIRITSPYRAFGGLAVQTGGTIGALPVPAVGASAVFTGDSITAGSIASTVTESFAALIAQRLGVDNYINVSVGGTGYLARLPQNYVSITTTSGSPDVTVNAGGGATAWNGQSVTTTATVTTGAFISSQTGLFPQDTTVITGAGSGGTATLSQNAGMTGTYIVRNETGRNMMDSERLNDVLQAVNGSPPDFLFIGAGINDRGVANEGFWTDAQLEAQALRYFQALRAGAPNMVIFVMGSMTNYNNPGSPTTVANATAAIFSAAAQVPRVVTIDTANIITLANRDPSYDEGTDVTHPNSYGHNVLADALWPTILSTVEGF